MARSGSRHAPGHAMHGIPKLTTFAMIATCFPDVDVIEIFRHTKTGGCGTGAARRPNDGGAHGADRGDGRARSRRAACGSADRCQTWRPHAFRDRDGDGSSRRRNPRHGLHLHGRQGRAGDCRDDRTRPRAVSGRAGRERRGGASRCHAMACALRGPRRRRVLRDRGGGHRPVGHSRQGGRAAPLEDRGRRRGPVQGLPQRDRPELPARKAGPPDRGPPRRRPRRGEDRGGASRTWRWTWSACARSVGCWDPAAP